MLGMKLLTSYIAALTNLYGIAPKKIVLEAYNAQNPEQITKEELDKQVRDSAEKLAEHFVVSMEEYFVDDSLLMLETDIPELLAEKADKPHYIPEKEELLRYEEDFYFEKTLAYQNFSNYIERCFPSDREYAHEVSEDIYDIMCLEGNLVNLFGTMELVGIRMKTEEQVLHIHKLAMEMFYHARLWHHNGHTLVEIAEMQGEPVENLYSEGIGVQFYDDSE